MKTSPIRQTQTYFILSGAMGSGKTTLCQDLKANGQSVVDEPARQILAEQRSFGGSGVPEEDPHLFTNLLLSRTLYAYDFHQEAKQPILFDRGVPDILAYAKLFNLETTRFQKAAEIYRYNPTVFMMADWPEIYTTDEERKMTYEQAQRFGQTLRSIYQSLNYTVIDVPQMNIQDRSNFIREHIHSRTEQ
ncbi:AAA family ATPase [Terasakiella pusilla]|uniref:AAA family ATPase n=1 Tax=Terasakiella pusilla TaxID=64973 RepID=UPI0006908DBE|nr:AAA family ATPase [Terasakiella pusilla]